MCDTDFKQLNIYCDESRHTNKDSPYLVIGALSCPRHKKKEIISRIHSLRSKHGIWREIGWKSISQNKKEFYFDLIQLFTDEPELNFRCLVTDKNALDHVKYSLGDNELGFYKLYYQMLVHWLQPSCSYYIFLDWQMNRDQYRFRTLRDILRRKLAGRARVECLEPVNSRSNQLIQLTDLFIGAVGYSWNEINGSAFKKAFCNELAKSLRFPTLHISTSMDYPKFNIFHFIGC